MAFQPDVIVTGSDPSEVLLVVEVKTSSRNLSASERLLKQYMTGVRSPTGLLVTPEFIWLFRDKYLASVDDSIVEIGEFNVRDVFHFRPTGDPSADALAFESRVQSWLEELSTVALGSREISPELKRALLLYVVPALEQGSVRSGHPRFQVTA